jgi:hypothetical protein
MQHRAYWLTSHCAGNPVKWTFKYLEWLQCAKNTFDGKNQNQAYEK